MKSRLTIIITAGVFLIVTLLLIGLHVTTKDEVVKRFQSRQLITANQLSNEIKSCLQNQTRSLEILSSLSAIKNDQSEAITKSLNEYFEYLKSDHLKSINIYDEKGTIKYSTIHDVISLNHSNQKFFSWYNQKENRNKQLITSDVPDVFTQREKSTSFHVMILSPIYKTSSDTPSGFISAILSLDTIFKNFFQSYDISKSSESAWILDNNGRVLYQAEHPEMITFSKNQIDTSCFECHKSFDYVETILANQSGSTTYQLKEREEKLSSYVTLNFNNVSWKIVVNTSLVEVTSFVVKNSIQTIILIIVILLILTSSSVSMIRSSRLKIKAETEAEILREKQAFNLILENAGEGIFGIDLNGNHTFINPMAAKLLGYKVEELIGKHSHTLWHHSRPSGEPYPGSDCHIYETLREGTTHSGEEYFWRKDGSGFPVNYSTTPMLESGKIVGAVVTFRDITENKRLELEQRVIYEITQGVTATANLDELLKLIHDSLKQVLYAENIFMALYNPGTELFEFPYFVDKFDPTPEPVAMKKSCTAYVFRSGKPLLLTQKLFDNLVKQNEVELVGTNSPSWIGVPLQTPSMTIGVLVLQHYEEENIYSERDVKFLESIGSQIAVVIERKRSEEALQNKRALLRTIIDLIPDAIYVKDSYRRKTLANPKEVEFSGKNSEEEVLGKTDEELFPDLKEHGFIAEDISVLESGKSIIDIEGKLIDKNGNVHWLLGLKVPLRDAQGKIIGIVGLNHDITERKRAEEEITKSNQQLSRTIAEKDKFFSIIAHDLRSPFSGFLSLTEMMVEDSDSISKSELIDLSKSMRDSALTVYKLLENLLEWAQMQKGMISFSPGEILLSDLVSFSINTISQRATQKGITIINEIPDSQKVYADEKMINTVLRNFLSNAVKFTKKDGKIFVRSKPVENEMVQISVQDTGIGMDQKDVSRLFKIEEKVSSRGTDDEPSTGLGLLLCKEFVEKNGGKVWVESEKMVGSTFYFTVPATKF